MLSTLFAMIGGIGTTDGFGVMCLLDSPGSKKHICCLVELLKASEYPTWWNKESYLTLEGKLITHVVVIVLNL